MIVRIKKIIEYEQISVRAFEQKIGASNGLIRKAITNNTDIQGKWLSIIADNYPHISTDWLLTGNGSMLRSGTPIATLAPQGTGIPLIPIHAMAGYMSGEVQVLEFEAERYIIPMFKEAEFLIPVKGSSMQPKYNSGDIVACKKLLLKDIFFQWNKVYVLDTDQGAIVKRIRKGSNDNTVNIVSENPAYEPFELSLNKIHSIAIVIGVIRLE